MCVCVSEAQLSKDTPGEGVDVSPSKVHQAKHLHNLNCPRLQHGKGHCLGLALSPRDYSKGRAVAAKFDTHFHVGPKIPMNSSHASLVDGDRPIRD